MRKFLFILLFFIASFNYMAAQGDLVFGPDPSSQNGNQTLDFDAKKKMKPAPEPDTVCMGLGLTFFLIWLTYKNDLAKISQKNSA